MDIRQIKKLSKIITVPISLAVALSGISAFAATTQTGDFEITSSGSISAKNGEEITIDVYYPDKTYTDLLNADIGDYTKILLRRDQTTVGERGKYEFKFKVGDIPTGEYTVRISKTNAETADDVVVETFIFSNPNDYKTAVAELNKATNTAELKSIIDKYSKVLGIDLTTEQNTEPILTVMLNNIKEESLNAEDIGSAKKCFEQAKLIFELNSNKITNINDRISILDLSKCGLDGYYIKAYVNEDVQKNLTSRVSGKNFDSIPKLYKSLCEQFVLAVVEKSGSNDAIKEVINGFSDKIGASASGLSERNLSELLGKNYNSFSALKSAIENLKQSGGNSPSSGGGSKGGSGGSIGGTKTYPTVVPDTDNKDIELNYYVFDDLDGVEWAREPICKLAEMGVLRGKEYRLFYPNDNITREEFVKMLTVAYKLNIENKTDKFTDVNANDWFMPYVAAALENGIVNGVSDDMFGTGQNITRQDLAVMAYNAACKAGMDFGESTDVQSFNDDDNISDYAKTAVYALKSQDIVNGIDGKNFAPQDTATRAEAAKILYALISLSN